MKNEYPRIKALGIPILNGNVLSSDVDDVLPKKERKIFSKLFGIQTCPMIKLDNGEEVCGLYAWDVEAVLERMKSGKLTGSQLFWD